MSFAGPGARMAVGVAGVTLMANAVYQYVSSDIDEYTAEQFKLGAMLTFGALVLPCALTQQRLDITPVIDPPSGLMWYRAGGANTPITVRVSMTKAPPPGHHYLGGGTLRRNAATIDVFRDIACTVPLVFDAHNEVDLNHDELLAGLLLYIRGTAAGNVQLTLTLDPSASESITVHEPAQRDVEVRAVNVIAPTLTVEGVVLVDRDDAHHPTTPSTATLGYTQTNPAYPCPDLQSALTFDARITCTAAALPYVSGTAQDNLALALLMKGVTAGSCNLSVQLSSASGLADPSWHIAPAVTETIRVEQLAFNPHRYGEGRNTAGNAQFNTRVAATPKARDLHEQNATNDFTLARVPIQRPNAAFWTHASHLTVTAGPGLQLFSDAAGTVAAAPLQQADFGAAELALWVKRTPVTALDPQPPGAVANPMPLRQPEKVVTRRYISCGATVGGRQLAFGDIVYLDTFGFDHRLDRRVGNATSAQLQGHHNPALSRQAALAIAAGHKFYEQFSAQYENRQNPAPHGGLYAAFRNALNVVGANHVKAAAGEAYVTNYLQLTHAITLHANMIALLRAYLLRVLNTGAAAPNYGFNQANGTPGTHAEVLAVNEMLAAGLPIHEITVATYKLHPSGGQGKPFVACTNCRGILLPPAAPAARVITG